MLTKGQTLARLDPLRLGDLKRPSEAMGVGPNDHVGQDQHYALGDATREDFDAAIKEAKAEGNLSRANVVRYRDPGPVYRRPETPLPPEAAVSARGRRSRHGMTLPHKPLPRSGHTCTTL